MYSTNSLAAYKEHKTIHKKKLLQCTKCEVWNIINDFKQIIFVSYLNFTFNVKISLLVFAGSMV